MKPQMISFRITKDEDGAPVAVIKDGSATIKMDVGTACDIMDAFDNCIFEREEFRGLSSATPFPLLNKYEIHDLLFNCDYYDGRMFTRVLSKYISTKLDSGSIKTYYDVITILKKYFSNKYVQEIIYDRTGISKESCYSGIPNRNRNTSTGCRSIC